MHPMFFIMCTISFTCIKLRHINYLYKAAEAWQVGAFVVLLTSTCSALAGVYTELVIIWGLDYKLTNDRLNNHIAFQTQR